MYGHFCCWGLALPQASVGAGVSQPTFSLALFPPVLWQRKGSYSFPDVLALGHDAVGWGLTMGDNLMVGHLASQTKSLQPVIVCRAVYLPCGTVCLPLVEGTLLGCPGDF